MSDSLHVYNPNVAAREPTAIECPQCKTQLRMLRPATVHTPIACCMCGATFYLQPVETAPVGPADGRYDYPGRPGLRPGVPPNRRMVPERRPRSPDDPPPTMTTPAPPAPVPGTHSAPGMPKPVKLPEHLQRNFRTRWLESVLGAALVLLLVVALCAGGFVLVRSIWSRPDLAAPTNPESDDSEVAASSPDRPPIAQTYQPPKALTRPATLFGQWESRVDDGSSSTFVFHPDGKVLISQAGDPPPAPFESNWYVYESKGEEMILDVGPEFAAMSNTRIKLRMTGPDAFTVMSQVRHGLNMATGELRYIRIGAAPEPTKADAKKEEPAKSQ
jgi:hypothetical protein